MVDIIRGRGAIKGIAEGEVLVCLNSIQGWAGIDDITGFIIEKGHIAEGESIDGKLIITAIQATFWQSLRKLNIDDKIQGYECLLEL